MSAIPLVIILFLKCWVILVLVIISNVKQLSLAWEFLTKNLKIPTEKLWVTVFKDDQETEDIWLKEY